MPAVQASRVGLARRAPVRRPPADVPRSIGVPQRGQCPSRRRSRDQVARVDAAVADRRARRRPQLAPQPVELLLRQLARPAAAARAARATGSRRPAGCRRRRSTRWSSSRALSGACRGRPARGTRRAPTSAASGPTCEKSGVDERAAEPALVAQREPAAVGELEREAVPVRAAPAARRPRSGPPSRGAGRAPARSSRPRGTCRAGGCAGSRCPASAAGDLARRVRAADVGVAVVDGDDLAAERAVDLLPGALGLGELGHEAESLRGAAAWRCAGPARPRPRSRACGRRPRARARARSP